MSVRVAGFRLRGTPTIKGEADMRIRTVMRLPAAACALIASTLLVAIATPDAHAQLMTCNAEADGRITVTPNVPGGTAPTTFAIGHEHYTSCTGSRGITEGSAGVSSFTVTLTAVGGCPLPSLVPVASFTGTGPGGRKGMAWNNGTSSDIGPGTVVVREVDIDGSGQLVTIVATSTITQGQFKDAPVVETLRRSTTATCGPRSETYSGTLVVG
jgi:hypothetical protein